MSYIAKRKRVDDYREGASRCKLAHLESSKFNSASIYKTLQESRQDRILDDCPEPDSDLPPPPLLYNGFGGFRDFISNSANILMTRCVIWVMRTTDGLGHRIFCTAYSQVLRGSSTIASITEHKPPQMDMYHQVTPVHH